MLENFKNFFSKNPKKLIEVKPLPMEYADGGLKGGKRESQTEETVNLGSLIRGYIGSDDYPREFVKIIEHLVQYNGDFSLAMTNLVSLANTEYEISISGKGIKDSAKIVSEIRSLEKSWYGYSGGINALRNDLLTQIIINGALSAEMIPTENLKGLKNIVTVPPVTIYFKFDGVSYIPYQVINGKEIRLNQLTYKYYALYRLKEQPYPIVPYLSALDNIVIEKATLNNLREVIKNLGILGFLEVLLTPPPRELKQNGGAKDETVVEYKKRLQGMLVAAEEQVKQGMSNGYLVGFEGQHSFNMRATTANVSGAKDLIQINTEMKHAGLKQSPFLLGRNYSTTESLALVVLTVLTAQAKNYQQTVDRFLMDAITLHLTLAGYKDFSVSVVSGKPLTSDELKDQQAYKVKIENYKALKDEGLITQEQFAQYVGLEKAAFDSPQVTQSNVSNIQEHVAIELFNQRYKSKEFSYSTHEHLDSHVSYDAADDLLQKYMLKYINSSKNNYRNALDLLMGQIGKSLGKGDLSLDNLIVKIFYTIASKWDEDFNIPQLQIINKHVTEFYSYFRKDKTIFGGLKDVPEATFNTFDLRSIEFMKNVDELYLGKFITDSSTKKRITNFITNTYLKEGFDLKSKESIEAFKSEFKGMLKGEEWKINQILSTSVSRIRYHAAVSYMDQAGFTTYRRVSISDRLRCSYCASLEGRTFTIQTTKARLSKAIEGTAENITNMTPFVTSIYKTSDELKDLTSDQIQAVGGECIPSHPECRCREIVEN